MAVDALSRSARHDRLRPCHATGGLHVLYGATIRNDSALLRIDSGLHTGESVGPRGRARRLLRLGADAAGGDTRACRGRGVPARSATTGASRSSSSLRTCAPIGQIWWGEVAKRDQWSRRTGVRSSASPIPTGCQPISSNGRRPDRAFCARQSRGHTSSEPCPSVVCSNELSDAQHAGRKLH